MLIELVNSQAVVFEYEYKHKRSRRIVLSFV